MSEKMFIALIGLLLLVACGGAVDTDEPPKLVAGEDVCHRCNMIISEEKYAAAYWTTDGESRLFDDAGGMFLYQMETSEEVASYWVHDLQDGQWLRADSAYFVYDPQHQTPMGFGLVTLADEEAAHSLAFGQVGAKVMDYDTFMSRLADGSLKLDPMAMGMQ